MSTTEHKFGSFIDEALELSVVGSFTRIGPGLRSRLAHWSSLTPTPGRVVVITGASSGLGRQAALELGDLGCSVICVGRNEDRLNDVVSEIRTLGGNASAERCELADLSATAELAIRLRSVHESIDVLIHNAGALSAARTVTAQGHELTTAVHLLSPYLLTELLRPQLSAADRAKVIFMTSGGMYTERFHLPTLEMDEGSYKGSVAYARAKRAQVVLVGALQRTEHQNGTDFHAVHPGWAKTPGVAESLPTFNRLLSPLLRSPAQGVDTLVWLATSPPGIPDGGQLWLDRKPRPLSRMKKTSTTPSIERHQQDELLEWLNTATEVFR